MSEKSNVIIEFTGIPGSGKTFVSNYIYNNIKDIIPDLKMQIYNRPDLNKIRKQRIKTKVQLLLHVLSVLLNLDVIALIIYLCVNRKEAATRCAKVRYLISILVQQKIIKLFLVNEKNSIILLDEGLLHLEGVFLEYEMSHKERQMKILKRFNRLTKKYSQENNIYIMVNGIPRVSFERISQREQGWPPVAKTFSIPEKEEYLNRCLNVYFFQRSCHNDKKCIILESENIECEKICKSIRYFVLSKLSILD